MLALGVCTTERARRVTVYGIVVFARKRTCTGVGIMIGGRKGWGGVAAEGGWAGALITVRVRAP